MTELLKCKHYMYCDVTHDDSKILMMTYGRKYMFYLLDLINHTCMAQKLGHGKIFFTTDNRIIKVDCENRIYVSDSSFNKKKVYHTCSTMDVSPVCLSDNTFVILDFDRDTDFGRIKMPEKNKILFSRKRGQEASTYFYTRTMSSDEKKLYLCTFSGGYARPSFIIIDKNTNETTEMADCIPSYLTDYDTDRLYSYAFSSQKQKIAAHYLNNKADSHTLRLYDYPSFEPIWTREVPELSLDIRFAQDGEYIMGHGLKDVIIVKTDTSETLFGSYSNECWAVSAPCFNDGYCYINEKGGTLFSLRDGEKYRQMKEDIRLCLQDDKNFIF